VDFIESMKPIRFLRTVIIDTLCSAEGVRVVQLTSRSGVPVKGKSMKIFIPDAAAEDKGLVSDPTLTSSYQCPFTRDVPTNRLV